MEESKSCCCAAETEGAPCHKTKERSEEEYRALCNRLSEHLESLETALPERPDRPERPPRRPFPPEGRIRC